MMEKTQRKGKIDLKMISTGGVYLALAQRTQRAQRGPRKGPRSNEKGLISLCEKTRLKPRERLAKGKV